jgi:AAA15 family ATPase/GTPase
MKITIENFLAFSEPVTFDLKKINLFIGANNCGKSTFSKFIELIQTGNISGGIIDIPRPKYLNYKTSNFNDLRNIASPHDKKIKSKFEFETSRNIIKIEFELSQIMSGDGPFDNAAGKGYITSFKINNHFVYNENKKLSGITLKKGLLLLKETILSFDGDYQHYEFSEWEFDEWTDNEPKFGNLVDVLNRFFLNEVLKFNVIHNDSDSTVFQDSLYSLNRKTMKNFDIEIIEKKMYLHSYIKDLEPQYLDSLFYAKQFELETPIKSMGTGFQNLIQIIANNSSESFNSYIFKNKYIPILQEPEIGLHPNWQAKIFKLLVEQHAIIETHSLVILRALQLEVAEGNYKPEDVIIHNFYRDKKGTIRINPIRISKTGILIGEFQSGFQDEVSEIEMKLWKIQQEQINNN